MQPPINDDDARTGAPSAFQFPQEAYNMAAATCRLEDILDTPDLKTNDWLHKARWLFHVALK
jgi:hypothetical protein